MSNSRQLARQQRRYRSQDLYGQRATNMSIGDYISRRINKGTKMPYAVTATTVPAGWYNAQGDPAGSVRYWDGQQWTNHFKP